MSDVEIDSDFKTKLLSRADRVLELIRKQTGLPPLVLDAQLRDDGSFDIVVKIKDEDKRVCFDWGDKKVLVYSADGELIETHSL